MLRAIHPTALTTLLKPEWHVEQYRHLHCHHYDACLDEAVRLEWTSWTCVGCALFAAVAAAPGHAPHAQYASAAM